PRARRRRRARSDPASPGRKGRGRFPPRPGPRSPGRPGRPSSPRRRSPPAGGAGRAAAPRRRAASARPPRPRRGWARRGRGCGAFREGRRTGCPWSGELEVALQLPGGDGPLVLPDLPGAGAEVVVDELLAEELAGDGAPVEESDGIFEASRQRRRVAAVGVSG